jgi:hypothetical protein
MKRVEPPQLLLGVVHPTYRRPHALSMSRKHLRVARSPPCLGGLRLQKRYRTLNHAIYPIEQT